MRAYYAAQRFFQSRIAGFPALRVMEVRDLSPHMRRITFAGRNLDGFATNDALHVKLLLPPEGARRDRWLAVNRTGKARVRAKDEKPVYRTYTIRAIDDRAGRVVIDFVLHGDGGPGSRWARQAQTGDVIGMIGPRGRGLSPADWYLIAGDETALPVIGRMLEMMPDDAKGVVIIEVEDENDRQALHPPPDMELRWLYRKTAPMLLGDVVKSVIWPADERTAFVWAGAEFDVAQDIRAHMRLHRNLPKERQLIVPYWRLASSSNRSGTNDHQTRTFDECTSALA